MRHILFDRNVCLPDTFCCNSKKYIDGSIILFFSTLYLRQKNYMKQTLLSISICFLTMHTFAQQSFIGIQNSPRKGMIHAAMNPAELNNLSRNVEVNLFSVGATANNNILSFQDIIK